MTVEYEFVNLSLIRLIVFFSEFFSGGVDRKVEIL